MSSISVHGFGTGYIPDVPAPEDLVYAATAGVILPDSVDLRPNFKNAVENQALTSSCSANAVVSNIEYLINMKYGKTVQFDYPELSRRFVYYEGRKVDGLQTVDAGSVIGSCVRRAATVGVCEESLFPFFTNPYAMIEPPPAAAYAEAARHKVLRYERLTTLNDMLECLSKGFPFVFGFRTYGDSMRIAGQTGKMPMPAGARDGGHAVCIVGYFQSTREFILRNSWGQNWGNAGYCTIPFDYVTDPNLSSDYWTIQDVDWKHDA